MEGGGSRIIAFNANPLKTFFHAFESVLFSLEYILKERLDFGRYQLKTEFLSKYHFLISHPSKSHRMGDDIFSCLLKRLHSSLHSSKHFLFNRFCIYIAAVTPPPFCEGGSLSKQIFNASHYLLAS